MHLKWTTKNLKGYTKIPKKNLKNLKPAIPTYLYIYIAKFSFSISLSRFFNHSLYLCISSFSLFSLFSLTQPFLISQLCTKYFSFSSKKKQKANVIKYTNQVRAMILAAGAGSQKVQVHGTGHDFGSRSPNHRRYKNSVQAKILAIDSSSNTSYLTVF